MNKIILMFLTLTLGGCMTTQSSKAIEKFDELFAGNPVDIEKNMKALLPKAKERSDNSIFVQILSQIAVAQSMQNKIFEAKKTLTEAKSLVKKNDKKAN